jgi:hypothetical protein
MLLITVVKKFYCLSPWTPKGFENDLGYSDKRLIDKAKGKEKWEKNANRRT